MSEEGSKKVETYKKGDIEVVRETIEATAEQPKSESVTVKVPCIISKFKFGGK